MEQKEEKKYMLFGVETSESAIRYLTDVVAQPIIEVAKHGALNGWDAEKIKAATEATARGIAWGIKSLRE
ncbi:hypothetical protein I2492_19480 [Budviciaceae bacterium CWB-B4]|uniref:Uncharacterized protein n=1 Tax=Limnobaculum xujianqingii TaxID=2738837 RepID=A0A9D7ALS5_9GAMM|nr:hypothetical protein [Limnobaculum xujianqingii]MBK5075183.1 hypothetical protein [Limnobaculum xujianqingii]MBK5178493.1 hypothetical protein [Limnobaculum xujianqingii]